MGFVDKFKEQSTNYKITVAVLVVLTIIFIIVGGVLTIGGPEICSCSKVEAAIEQGQSTTFVAQLCRDTCKAESCSNTYGCTAQTEADGGTCTDLSTTHEVCIKPSDTNTWGQISETNGKFIAGIILLFLGVVLR